MSIEIFKKKENFVVYVRERSWRAQLVTTATDQALR